MNISEIEKDFQSKICKEVSLISEGINRYIVSNPYILDDGDVLPIYLKKYNGEWILSDEGNSFMRLSYEMDIKNLQKGNRQEIINSIINKFDIYDKQGELILKIEGDNFGDSFYSYVQGLLQINDINFLSRETVRSTFMEDFFDYMTEHIDEKRRTFDYAHPEYDKHGNYVVDCKVNTMKKPLFVFAVPNDDRCQLSTITCLNFEKWKVPFHSLAIFEEQENINRKILARFSDVCEKQYSSLYSNVDRIDSYIKDYIAEYS